MRVRMVMLVIATMPRARSVIAAAGVLRAPLVVDAEDRIHADPVLAGSTGIAIFIDAALGTHVVRLAIAADESIAAIELRDSAGVGYLEEPTGLPGALAAIGHRGADTRIADLAIAAIAIRATFSAVAGVAGNAALPNAAIQCQIGAGLCGGNAEMRALTQRHACIVAAFLALAALPEAGAVVTELAGATVLVALASVVATGFVANLAARATAGPEQAILALVVFVADATSVTDPAVLNNGAEMIGADASTALTRTGAVGIAAAVTGNTPFSAVDFARVAPAAAGNLRAGTERAVSDAGVTRPITGGVTTHILGSKTTTAVLRRAHHTGEKAAATCPVANAWWCTTASRAKRRKGACTFRASEVAGFTVVVADLVTAEAVDA
jgi:hypothetical protein